MKKITMLLAFMLVSFYTYGQFPEDFSNAVPPAGWSTFTGTNGLGTQENWERHLDYDANPTSYVARVRGEYVGGSATEDWLVTPVFVPTASNNILVFDQRQANESFHNSLFKIKISTTSQSDLNSFTTVDTQFEGNFATTYTQHSVDLSDYIGTPIFIAFVMEQNSGNESWYIDNINMVQSVTTPNIFPEDFSTAAPPQGWLIFTGNNGLGTQENWERHLDYDANPTSYVARVRGEYVGGATTQDYLVTPRFTPSPTSNVLVFDQRQANSSFHGSTFMVMVSTADQVSHSNLVVVDTQQEGDFATDYTQHSVDLSAYNGTPIYIAFVLEQDSGNESWYIDNINMEAVSTTPFCTPSTNSSDGETDYSLTFSGDTFLDWDSPTLGTSPEGYEVFIGTQSGNLTSIGNASGSLAYVRGLEYNTTYYWSVVPFNTVGSASGCSTEWSFTTESQPPTFSPFFQEDFNGSLPEWQLASGLYADPTGFATTNFGYRFDSFANNAVNSDAATFNIYGEVTRAYLITPRFNLSGQTYYLNFDIALTPWQTPTFSTVTFGAGDYVALLVTQDSGDSWTELTRWDSTTPISGEGQAANEIELSGYGNNVRFAFYGFSGSTADNDFFIDNFTISDTTASTEYNNLSGVTVYPTIVNNILNIDSDTMVDEVSIYDLLGKQVFSSNPTTDNVELNLSQLKAGVYIVRLQVENTIGTYKIVKQ